MIKLIATDLDNTLLSKEGSVTPESVSLIREARSLGVSVAIATGRSWPAALVFAEEIGTACPVICFNGALIRDSLSGRKYFSSYLPTDLTRGILSFAREKDVYMQIYVEDVIVCEHREKDVHKDPDLRRVRIIELPDLSAALNRPTHKVLISAPPHRVPGLMNELNERFRGLIYMAQSEPWLIEIMEAGVDKGAALLRLAGLLGIKREETMAIGDNTNDLLLLKAAGTSVCVANAVPEVKAIADHICMNERDLGFNEALRELVIAPARKEIK